jgi:hypothetical protein
MEVAMKHLLLIAAVIVASIALLSPAQAGQKKSDKASSTPMNHSVGGKYFDNATIEMRRAPSTSQTTKTRDQALWAPIRNRTH